MIYMWHRVGMSSSGTTRASQVPSRQPGAVPALICDAFVREDTVWSGSSIRAHWPGLSYSFAAMAIQSMRGTGGGRCFSAVLSNVSVGTIFSFVSVMASSYVRVCGFVYLGA